MSEPFIGQIQAFGFNFAPRGWASCDGQLLSIAQNTALFSLLGTFYGGDGRTTFGLPDLRGRVSLHHGGGAGLSNRPIGQRSGVENVVLSTSNLPSHNHTQDDSTLRAAGNAADTNDPTGNSLALAAVYNASAPTVDMAAGSITNPATGNTGNSGAHENMPPFLVINYCIALVGLFPSRN